MEQVYALGVTCIQFVQEWFQDYEGLFEFINNVSNPYNITENMFPLVSILDSVFAAQLLLCLAFGGWLNAVMKWWLLEDRPYWWVNESTYYTNATRPRLLQTHQTCETGPGSPSGHSSAISLLLALANIWVAHVATDRKWRIPWYVQRATYICFAVMLGAVILSRLYVAAHFPHQCVLGALVGLFLAPALCIYVTDPYIWRYGAQSPVARGQRWHVASAGLTVAIAVLTYWGLRACDHDPHFTVKLAYRWCDSPESIRVTTTPMFALVQCTAYLLGWALAVTPVVARYRHDTKNRSLMISAFATALVIYTYKLIDEQIPKTDTFAFYIAQFVIFATKPMIMLRIVPSLAMWPFNSEIKIKSK